MSCPNRDGKIGYGGCIFCSGGGSGDFAVKPQKTGGVTAQIELAKEKIRQKTDADLFIAYFQSYTNTHAPVEYLRQIFMEAIAHPQVAVLSIGTRPDCLGWEVVQLLAECNRIKPVWIELGLQTIHEKTANYIRRGYELSCYENAVKSLRAEGIEVITHVILGLPGETKEDMLETVRYLAKRHDTQGIKLQLLHVLKQTDLAEEYEKGVFQTLSMEKYLDILFDCIRELPPDMVLHRITGDGPKSLLISPTWSGNKKMVLNTLRKEMKEKNVVQGTRYFAE